MTLTKYGNSESNHPASLLKSLCLGITFLTLIVLTTTVSAQTKRVQDIDRLAIELGIPQVLAVNKENSINNGKEQFEAVFSQLRKNGIPSEVLEELQQPMEAILVRIRDSWDTNEAARIYTAEIASTLTDREIKETLKFYSSKEGKQSLTAIHTGQSKMNSYINGKVKETMQEEFGAFMAQIKIVMEKHIQKKNKPAAH